VLIYAGILLVAFIFALVLGMVLIPVLRRLKIGQSIRTVGPKRHLSKAGTPTMGGVIFLVSALVVTAVFMPRDPLGYLVLFMAVAFGSIGFADDYLKVVRKQPLGLKARYKLAGQIVFSIVFYLILKALSFDEVLVLPWLGAIDLGWAYPIFILLVMVGTVNAVNLSDGLDGLAGGLGVITLLGFAVIGWLGNIEGLIYISVALAGGIMGFLVFNLHPAKVFMGDTGSLAIGGAIAAMAVLAHTEILLLMLGIVFVLETISVIIQVLYFKMTRRRVFLMAPIHHHFELKGWSEWKVCLAFWLIQLAGTVAALAIWLAAY
jgi:phospho-N-acetylmuramoyl-pentapeptide-transferase